MKVVRAADRGTHFDPPWPFGLLANGIHGKEETGAQRASGWPFRVPPRRWRQR